MLQDQLEHFQELAHTEQMEAYAAVQRWAAAAQAAQQVPLWSPAAIPCTFGRPTLRRTRFDLEIETVTHPAMHHSLAICSACRHSWPRWSVCGSGLCQTAAADLVCYGRPPDILPVDASLQALKAAGLPSPPASAAMSLPPADAAKESVTV
jgi:hypothetical protein